MRSSEGGKEVKEEGLEVENTSRGREGGEGGERRSGGSEFSTLIVEWELMKDERVAMKVSHCLHTNSNITQTTAPR